MLIALSRAQLIFLIQSPDEKHLCTCYLIIFEVVYTSFQKVFTFTCTEKLREQREAVSGEDQVWY